jgi:UDP-4-amino-4,6-dideoxy-N-acetyl-beta-L-altrosamine transaminase
MPMMIPYSRHTIDEDDIRAVIEVLHSDFLTTGPKVKEFEQAVCAYVGATEAVAFSSGTAALHAAMAVVGLGPGDEVLVPSLSFIATANAVLYVGARPVFVDSLPGEFNMDTADAARKITPRTKAIVPVHFAGQPVNLTVLQQLATKHHLAVIEDAAHAFGAVHEGKPIGSHSTMTVFSFHPAKHITTGEGGMVVTSQGLWVEKLRQFRHHGIDIGVTERNAKDSWQYDMASLGYNYRITDIQCALGISQLKKAERFLQRREQIVARYDQAFRHNPSFEIPPRPSKGGRHAWHLYTLRLNTRDDGQARNDLFARLRTAGIGVQVHYQPIHWHSYYQRLGWKKGDCPQTEKTFPRMLTLPLFPAMTDEMVQRVITTVQSTIQQVR